MSAPGLIMIILDPISEMLLWMLFLVPWPTASIVITDAMPAVRKDRILLAAMARRAIFKRLLIFII